MCSNKLFLVNSPVSHPGLMLRWALDKGGVRTSAALRRKTLLIAKENGGGGDSGLKKKKKGRKEGENEELWHIVVFFDHVTVMLRPPAPSLGADVL